MKRTGLLLAVLGFALSACTVTVDEGNPPPRPRPPRPEASCPRIYEPVCAYRGGERRAFNNACEAESRGFYDYRDGDCGRPGRPPRPRPPRPEPISEPVACPLIEAPVCARQGRVVRTFSNACIAEGSGFSVIDRGPC